jgi:transcriptional regulator with XRE-family HTH domain
MGYGMSPRAATPLQAARLEIGWKQAQTIRALQQVAADDGVTIATERSLKTMLSRWENGHDSPDALGQRLLCRIYGQTPEELGFGRKDQGTIVLPRLAPAVGPDMVAYFRNVFTEHLRADNLMGPHHLVDVVRAQTTLLDQMLPNARDDVRRELLMLAFRYNEFAGWLYQDACDPDSAMRYTDRSMEYAMEIGEARETSYVLMRKADIAGDLDNPDRVIGLTQAALRNPSRVIPRVKALVLRLRGRAYAQLGNPGECARALDAAYEEVLRPDDGPDGLTDYCTPSYIGMEAANCWSRLGRFDAAVATYERSLPTWPISLRRDQGLCLARLTNAYAGRGDFERAAATGRQAVDVVRSATSSRALNELQRVRVRLAPLRRHAEVSDLSDRIRSLIQPAA